MTITTERDNRYYYWKRVGEVTETECQRQKEHFFTLCHHSDACIVFFLRLLFTRMPCRWPRAITSRAARSTCGPHRPYPPRTRTSRHFARMRWTPRGGLNLERARVLPWTEGPEPHRAGQQIAMRRAQTAMMSL